MSPQLPPPPSLPSVLPPSSPKLLSYFDLFNIIIALLLLLILFLRKFCNWNVPVRTVIQNVERNVRLSPPPQPSPPLSPSIYQLVTVDTPDWEKIKEIIESHNDNFIKTTMNVRGWYLLHYACQKHAPSEFVIQLINDYPKACEEKTIDGWFPLHIACKYEQSDTVIQLLILNYPKACEEKTNSGLLPLHLACRYIQSESVIEFLITKCPKACKAKKFNNEWLPLHCACRYNQSLSVIQSLVRHWPESIMMTDNDNKTPLDLTKNSTSNDDDERSPNQEVIDWLESVTPAEIKRRYETYAFALKYVNYSLYKNKRLRRG